ncbi:hypothetical protein [Paenibacillus sp. L3-i20]|uniref:hypothetical protein n=1 Tax=Paenibacillus sp. L3-i20 TaxID=2905833 RepID=UPI001EE06796|nr:hypothetical protein [Paenibacillus sp. L3-i20]GKU78233.1 hypothetical protein L3i20_v226300 [Paenibacillus sp. L3-i20]
MKNNNRKQKMTKLLLTATMCALLMFTVVACNSGDPNNASNGANDGTNNAPMITEEPEVPNEPETPEDSTSTP